MRGSAREAAERRLTLFFFSLAASLVPNFSTNTASIALLTSTADAHLSHVHVHHKSDIVSDHRAVRAPWPPRAGDGRASSLEVRLLERSERLPQIIPARWLDHIKLSSDQCGNLFGRDVDPCHPRTRSVVSHSRRVDGAKEEGSELTHSTGSVKLGVVGVLGVSLDVLDRSWKVEKPSGSQYGRPGGRGRRDGRQGSVLLVG